MPHCFAHISTAWKMQDQRLLKKSVGTVAKVSQIFCSSSSGVVGFDGQTSTECFETDWGCRSAMHPA
jgi:hypothetical protein